MAVYNDEGCVGSAIESILNQIYENFEFIIIDDCSKDKSLEIIEKYTKLDKRIRIIKNTSNIGLTKSLNKGIRISKGEFIARIDADDFSLPDRLEKQLSFLQKNLNYTFCGSDVFFKQNKEKSLKFFELEDIKRNLIANNCFMHSTILIRKDILKKYGLYNEKYLYGQDYELWCRLIYKYQLKAKNLRDKLVVCSEPIERRSFRNKKAIIQHKNHIKCQLMYLKHINNPLSIIKALIIIFKKSLEILYKFLGIYI